MGKINVFIGVSLFVLASCCYISTEPLEINKRNETLLDGQPLNKTMHDTIIKTTIKTVEVTDLIVTQKYYTTKNTILMKPDDIHADIEDVENDEFYKMDVPDIDTLNTLHKYATVDEFTDNHKYYSSRIYTSKFESEEIWKNLKYVIPTYVLQDRPHDMLTIKLSFVFPFYGEPVENLTVSTAGFLCTGQSLKSLLAPAQYIAPLMAHFNSIYYRRSLVRINDNKTALTVLWEEMGLYIEPEMGKFTFSATLHQNGEIVFVYFNIPVKISEMKNTNHPVKIGISDAYMLGAIDYIILVRHETIYEYNRINFTNLNLLNSTIIRLTPLPTCAKYEICAICVHHQLTLGCTWCPTLRGCFSEFDRYKNNSINKACNNAQVKERKICYFLGDDGYSSNYFNKTNSIAVVGGNHINKFNTTDNANEHETTNKTGWILIFMLCSGMILIVLFIFWAVYSYQNPHSRSFILFNKYRNIIWFLRRERAYTIAPVNDVFD